MKADFIERIALGTGWFGYWFTIFYAAFPGALLGLICGAFASGIVSAARNVDVETDQVGGWLIVVFSLVGAILSGGWCRRRLIRLKKEETDALVDNPLPRRESEIEP